MDLKTRFAARLGFLAAELALCIAILMAGVEHFIAIVSCFCFSLLQGKNSRITADLHRCSKLLPGGM